MKAVKKTLTIFFFLSMGSCSYPNSQPANSLDDAAGSRVDSLSNSNNGRARSSFSDTDNALSLIDGGRRGKKHVSVVCFTSNHDDLVAWRCWQVMSDLTRKKIPFDGPAMDPPRGAKPPVFRNPDDIHLNPTPDTCKVAGQQGVDYVVFIGHCTDLTGNGEGDIWGDEDPVTGIPRLRCPARSITEPTQEGGVTVIWSMCNPDIVPTIPGQDMIWCAEGGGLLDTRPGGNDRWQDICESIRRGKIPETGAPKD